MKLKSIYLKDSLKNITIENTTFENLTIFVGTSGAGKTTIMNAIYTVIHIAKGNSSPGDSWDIEFIDNHDREIKWSGTFSANIELDLSDDEDDDEIEVSAVENEFLYIEGKLIFERNEDSIKYNDNSLPLIDKNTSLLYLMRNDKLIETVYDSLSSVKIATNNSRDFTNNTALQLVRNEACEKNKKLMADENLNIKQFSEKFPELTCREKMYYCFNGDKESFEEFEYMYTSIFTNVEKVIVEDFQDIRHRINRSAILIRLELSDGTIIDQGSMSSGMFKSLTILAELLFSSDKSILVIDEIENSLGINCLSDILEIIQSNRSQAILSTHHPKVINNIPPSKWRIVSRKGGEIKTYKAESINNSSSQHDKFLQLINSEIYLNGAVG
ncbi:AAA family ATPase [Pseudoalteromonas sp. T1lg122]|uniref:AAA family ATPase n=1 Tax=Pseudoalteromonas sp. T1lg122 TaxID=2077094 RepID=UPI000CF61AF3|nr:AAA family ATPase [Pseudoalteromonas sp. T1lg122]